MRELIWRIMVAFFRIIPSFCRKLLCKLSFAAAEKNSRTASGLKELMFLDERLMYHLNQAAIRYEGGIHPKHRLMEYHRFFVERIGKDETVIDIGCGNGAVAMSIAEAGAVVTGIDLNEDRIASARQKYNHENLNFICGDVTVSLPDGPYDVIVMSNVLEHIHDRINLLQKLQNKFSPDRFLIRVPMINRHWLVPLKRELGMPYFIDSTHCIEYTLNSFRLEMAEAGLEVHHYEIAWGEIWAEALPCQ